MPTGTYSVRIEGLEETLARLREYPQIVVRVMNSTMRRVVIRLADNIGSHTPVYMNRLKTAILASPKVEVMGGDIRGVVDASDVPYAMDMEVGPPAGEWPDMAALRRWCHLVLNDASLAGAVAQALYEGRSRVQRRPYAMFARGWDDTAPWAEGEFERALVRIVEELAR